MGGNPPNQIRINCFHYYGHLYCVLLKSGRYNWIGLKICWWSNEDGGEIGGSGVQVPSTPVKYLADMRSRATANSIPAYMKIRDQR